MASAPKKDKNGAGFVIFRRKKEEIEYLLLQTSKSTQHWSPPKGHLKRGESSLDAAFRETEEETGLTKSDYKIMDFEETSHYEAHGKPKIVTYWLAELVDPDTEVKLSEEHQEFRWLPLEKACEVSRFEEVQKLLRACHEFLTAGDK